MAYRLSCRTFDCFSGAEQAAQERGELHRHAVVAGTLLYPPLAVLERRHWVMHDAQVVLSRDLARGLADAEQLAEAGSPSAWEEVESGHQVPLRVSVQLAY